MSAARPPSPGIGRADGSERHQADDSLRGRSPGIVHRFIPSNSDVAMTKAQERKRLEDLIEALKPAGEAMQEETDSLKQRLEIVKQEEARALELVSQEQVTAAPIPALSNPLEAQIQVERKKLEETTKRQKDALEELEISNAKLEHINADKNRLALELQHAEQQLEQTLADADQLREWNGKTEAYVRQLQTELLQWESVEPIQKPAAEQQVPWSKKAMLQQQLAAVQSDLNSFDKERQEEEERKEREYWAPWRPSAEDHY